MSPSKRIAEETELVVDERLIETGTLHVCTKCGKYFYFLSADASGDGLRFCPMCGRRAA